jgi:hypothetical protein
MTKTHFCIFLGTGQNIKKQTGRRTPYFFSYGCHSDRIQILTATIPIVVSNCVVGADRPVRFLFEGVGATRRQHRKGVAKMIDATLELLEQATGHGMSEPHNFGIF